LHIGEEDRYAVQLAVEEACTNIVDHAYAGARPTPTIAVLAGPAGHGARS
jgi:anti-sigma regulatory factor (Ser/Thr protein kinase)